ncbi:hypothetical protein PLIIFM63780_005425 [Purpureocillium lilacinum]|uniref:uncharacterized protein n=1 Tax=Purpureocillium lilacinum TaxID=33203 RepID=UPI00208051B3|nr:hypothetical protein PLICBS_006315 [Purpureocillium lilacinum]GJN81889.1 hypothetical protein PLIIFM63780_005425 [Purpureocillium lilacinum]
MELTTSLAIESWILYAVGVAVVVCRMLSRRIKLGKWRHLMIDDYLMVFALVNFTGVVVSINEVAKNGSNYMSPEDAAALTPEGVDRAVYGSIMTFVLEIFTLTATWTVKACLLMLYARLTRNTLTKQHLLVKIAAVYCALTYLIVTFMFVFYWCSPTYEYWAVPVRIRLGIFNILAAILNRYYNFSTPNSYVFLFWYVAEVGVAMLVGNLPLCWPILRTVLGTTESSKTPSYHGETISGGGRPKRHKHPLSAVGTTVMGTMWDKIDDQEFGTGASEGAQTQRTPSDQGSQIELVLQGHNHNHHHHAAVSANEDPSPDTAQILQPSSSAGSSGAEGAGKAGGDKIMVVTTVDVSSESQHGR